MEQESISKNIAIVGAGASGGFAAILLAKNPYNNIVLFDIKQPFSTLLPTGGGRCNISFDEKDVKEFVKNYPRGEKFLLSVFSRFGVDKTRSLFKDLGVSTYIQDDKRIFPTSNSSVDVIRQLTSHLRVSNVSIKKELVKDIKKKQNGFEIITEKKSYFFDYVVIATGGRGNGFDFAEKLGHKIIEKKPSLSALDISEKFIYSLSGLTFKSVRAKAVFMKKKYNVEGDLLFTHKSISGPLIFKISALSAYDDFTKENPLEIALCLTDSSIDCVENAIKNNSKKSIKNVFSMFAPESYINAVLQEYNIDANKQIAQIKKKEKEVLIDALFNLKIHATGRIKDSEIVTAGGVDLNEINSKTMESKLVNGLYFIGEVMNIDAFTGGFNLQSCWSTAFICSISI
ncbi:aminoacetone oxidase family FAD-binding enzyme [bacterium]|nr:aminoacetone oxidase family FAD-binding enzyme [bacterium]